MRHYGRSMWALLALQVEFGDSHQGVVRLNRFQRMALITTLVTYLLIGVGGLVRASGAGLGCPDWPQCFGLWVPPLSAAYLPPEFDPQQFNVLKTWTEYLNRLLGALTGILILVTLALAVRDHRDNSRVVWPSAAAFGSVLVNGWLGGKVVETHLAPWVLTAHLTLALILVSLLLYATVNAFYVGRGIEATKVALSRRQLAKYASLVILMLGIQIAFGALLRGQVQQVADAGIVRGEWLAHVGWVEIIHRSYAPLVTGLVLWVCSRAWSEKEIQLRVVAAISAMFVVGQVLGGYGLSVLDFPPVLQVFHLWFASLLLGSLSVMVLLAWRMIPEGS